MATKDSVPAPSTPRVGIYLRISQDRDGQQTATGRQRQDCLAYAERRGWEVADEFEDVDISAYQLKAKRPEFERMLDALRQGDLDGVVVWKLDRLTRQQRDLVRTMEACEPHKAFVASVTEPIDTRESLGQFIAEFMVAQARMESSNTSLRQLRKAREQKEQGDTPANGKRCFGYTRGYTAIIPEEAALLREAKDRLLAGESLNGVCADWARREVTSAEGLPWRPQWLRRSLTTATVAGHREHEGQLYEGKWPAILTRDELLQMRALVTPRTNVRKSPARSYLLTGFIRCGSCGERMYAHGTGAGQRRYVCAKGPGLSNCGKMSITAEPLEDLVLEMLVVAVDDAALSAALAARADVSEDVLEAIVKDEASLEQLARDYYTEQLISREEFLTARSTLTKRLEANRMSLARRQGRGVLADVIGDGQKLRKAWLSGTLEWRRAVVGALLDRVNINPTNVRGRGKTDPSRVAPVWRY